MGRAKPHRDRGSGIVEGVAGICLVTSSSILALLLLINSGCGILYKQKLSHVNYLATAYAAAHGGDANVQDETTEYVKQVMSAMGMAPNGLSVTVTEMRFQNSPAIKVTLSNEFPLTGAAFGIPPIINLSDSEIAIW
jgi:hypothetical protein